MTRFGVPRELMDDYRQQFNSGLLGTIVPDSEYRPSFLHYKAYEIMGKPC